MAPASMAGEAPPPDLVTYSPARPKNIRNAMIPWNVRALNDASAPMSTSIPNSPSNMSVAIPPIISRKKYRTNRMPPIKALDANSMSIPETSPSPTNSNKLNSTIATAC